MKLGQGSVNDRSLRLDDDGDAVVVAVAEPVKWHDID
jgi:hypothetical protein